MRYFRSIEKDFILITKVTLMLGANNNYMTVCNMYLAFHIILIIVNFDSICVLRVLTTVAQFVRGLSILN